MSRKDYVDRPQHRFLLSARVSLPGCATTASAASSTALAWRRRRQRRACNRVIGWDLEERWVWRDSHELGELVGAIAKPRVGGAALHQQAEVTGKPLLGDDLNLLVVADLALGDGYR